MTDAEKEKLNNMIKVLPGSYRYIGDLIDVLPEQNKTVDYLKGKINWKKKEHILLERWKCTKIKCVGQSPVKGKRQAW